MTTAAREFRDGERLALAECYVAKGRPISCAEWSARTRGTLLALGLVARSGGGAAITDAGREIVATWGALWPGNGAPAKPLRRGGRERKVRRPRQVRLRGGDATGRPGVSPGIPEQHPQNHGERGSGGYALDSRVEAGEGPAESGLSALASDLLSPDPIREIRI